MLRHVPLLSFIFSQIQLVGVHRIVHQLFQRHASRIGLLSADSNIPISSIATWSETTAHLNRTPITAWIRYARQWRVPLPLTSRAAVIKVSHSLSIIIAFTDLQCNPFSHIRIVPFHKRQKTVFRLIEFPVHLKWSSTCWPFEDPFYIRLVLTPLFSYFLWWKWYTPYGRVITVSILIGNGNRFPPLRAKFTSHLCYHVKHHRQTVCVIQLCFVHSLLPSGCVHLGDLSCVRCDFTTSTSFSHWFIKDVCLAHFERAIRFVHWTSKITVCLLLIVISLLHAVTVYWLHFLKKGYFSMSYFSHSFVFNLNSSFPVRIGPIFQAFWTHCATKHGGVSLDHLFWFADNVVKSAHTPYLPAVELRTVGHWTGNFS